MPDLTVSASAHDFRPVRAAMQRYVDQDILAGMSYAVLEGRRLVDLQCLGWADRETRTPLRVDHLFRIFSNTKLVTSCAVLLLMEDGLLGLDDPIGSYIPQLAHPRVLRPGASSLDDTEPASGPITIRQLLSHSAGLSYGLLDPGSLMYKAYVERKMLNPSTPLAAMMDVLSELPLLFHPGTSWEYSVATDVLARLVEVVSGQRFDAFLQQRIFSPLGMLDTGFVVPESERQRLTAYYRGADVVNPMKPGLSRIDHSPYPGAYLSETPRLSGGGGLVSACPIWCCCCAASCRAAQPCSSRRPWPKPCATSSPTASRCVLPAAAWPARCMACWAPSPWRRLRSTPQARPANYSGAGLPAHTGGSRRMPTWPAY